MQFFADDDYYTGPLLTENMVRAAEVSLKRRLPEAYLELLRERNGGVPLRRCFRTSVSTSWAADHVEISGLRGIGGDWGIDSSSGIGSDDMIAEWGYPDIGIVICDTPSAGHDTIMLDYSSCGPSGEPSVVYVDENRCVLQLAQTFAEFRDGLVECDEVGTMTRSTE